MALLQVRNLPDDLYENLTRVASLENRSITQEVIVLLREALEMKTTGSIRRQDLLKQLDGITIPDTGGYPDPAELIREDRNR